MSAEAGPGLEDIFREAAAFRSGFSSLVMATADGDGHPHASYAVYVADASGALYIYISALATHTRNLMQRRFVSIMFIEDESQIANPFSRKRLTIECGAELIPRETSLWDEILARFAERHGGIVAVLKGLPDFQLFRLVPARAVYVRGFGQAFTLGPEQFLHGGFGDEDSG
jgi:hypothetical protein